MWTTMKVINSDSGFRWCENNPRKNSCLTFIIKINNFGGSNSVLRKPVEPKIWNRLLSVAMYLVVKNQAV